MLGGVGVTAFSLLAAQLSIFFMQSTTNFKFGTCRLSNQRNLPEEEPAQVQAAQHGLYVRAADEDNEACKEEQVNGVEAQIAATDPSWRVALRELIAPSSRPCHRIGEHMDGVLVTDGGKVRLGEGDAAGATTYAARRAWWKMSGGARLAQLMVMVRHAESCFHEQLTGSAYGPDA